MKFRKIYVEITNKCNLACSFCIKSNRERKEMSVEEFTCVIEKIKNYTKTIYLHIKGEPLFHSQLDAILAVCDTYGMRVNITTNATLLEHKVAILKKHACIRKLNISLHSENKMHNYYERVMSACDCLKDIYVVYRLWTLDDYKLNAEAKLILDALAKHYRLDEDKMAEIIKEKHVQISDKVIVDKENMFVWPDVNNDFTHECGYCFGLKTHLGILSNGDVVPCCLDGEGILKLGNIFEESLEEILEKDKTKNIKKGFQDRKPFALLCKKCGFLSRLDTNKKQ